MTRITIAVAILVLSGFAVEAATSSPGGPKGGSTSSAGQSHPGDGGNGQVLKPKKSKGKKDKQDYLIIKLHDVLVTG